MNFNFEQLNYTVTRSHDAQKDRFTNHVHTFYEMLFIYRGKGRFLIEDTEYEFNDNTLFLIPPGKYHVLQKPPEKNYERCFLYFPSSLLPAPLEKKLSLQRQTDERVCELFDKMEAYSEKYSGQALYSLFCAFITEVLVSVVFDESDKITHTSVPVLVKNTIEYINSNLDKELSAQSIADAMFVSCAYLGHIFSDTMNTGLMHYVTIKKMYKARSMIRKGASAREASEALGYKSYPTFWRNYKAHFGKSPSEEI